MSCPCRYPFVFSGSPLIALIVDAWELCVAEENSDCTAKRLPLCEKVFSGVQGAESTHVGNFFGSTSQNFVLSSPASELLENF